MDDGAASSSAVVSRVYRRLRERVERTRRLLRRPMTLTEKVLANHLRQPADPKVARGISYVDFEPDRVVLQDALAQVVLLQFMLAGLEETAVPTTVHCDHLVQAKAFAASDLRRALDANEEIYDFLRAACAAYGIGFWEPGSGIIHQVVFEHYAFPGGMMIGTDSHTPNAGGMGMVAVGVGGGDAIDVMSASALNLRWPHVIGVRLTGSLSGWASPKDVILSLTNRLTVRGGTGAVIEYFGPGADTISATGKGTICNMGAETGATTSLFPYDANIAGYLTATRLRTPNYRNSPSRQLPRLGRMPMSWGSMSSPALQL
jgi:aconitate hydratase